MTSGYLALILSPLLLLADTEPSSENISPQVIQQELQDAEAQFAHALTLFDPWYTGPLVTPSPSLMPLGSAMIQPYLFLKDFYGFYNEDRDLVSMENKFQLLANPLLIQVGVTPSVDALLITTVEGNWQKGASGGGFGDLSFALGFLISQEGLYYPKAKFTVMETFPTGTYNNLSSDGLALSGTGQGTYSTSFTLALGKLFFWNTLHPLNTRIALVYAVNTPVDVSGFNVYGGGFGTKGTLLPGNSLSADLGLEWTVSQPWVIALDIAYTNQNRTRFQGHHGTTATGAPASVGGGYSDTLSLAPALEYNFNGNRGLIGGFWFSVYGRNAESFASAVFSWFWQFP